MAVGAVTIGLLLGLLFIPLAAAGSPWLARRLRAGQHIRPEGPSTHGAKAGTPTMGGLVPLSLITLGIGVLLPFGLGAKAGFVLLATLSGAVVGLLDDLRSQRGKRSVGFVPHQTLLLQSLLGGGLAAAALFLLDLDLAVPFSSAVFAAVPAYVWVPLVILGFVGTVNGVNLTDGLDGLATGLWVLALFGLLPVLRGQPGLVATATLALGAGLGFLWANAHPAAVFLGNVGSMGLGGFLFGLATAGGGLLFLPLVGGVFVLEALAVILQVASYKLTGVRLLKMAPLHHHLEDAPVPWPHRIRSPRWPEPKVVVRLWILGAGFALVAVLAARMG